MLDENTITAVIQSREDQGNGVAVLRALMLVLILMYALMTI